MAIELTALIVGFGLLARWMRNVFAENSRLRGNEQLARECMRDAMAHRDRLVVDNASLTAKLASSERVCEEQCRLLAEAGERERDAREACVGLTEELDAVCAEFGVRERRVVWMSRGGRA